MRRCLHGLSDSLIYVTWRESDSINQTIEGEAAGVISYWRMADTGDIIFRGCGAEWSYCRDVAREYGDAWAGRVCAEVLRDFYSQQKRMLKILEAHIRAGNTGIRARNFNVRLPA